MECRARWIALRVDFQKLKAPLWVVGAAALKLMQLRCPCITLTNWAPFSPQRR